MPAPSRSLATRATVHRVRRAILAWYAVAQRDFPWRRTRDPWTVLVSEVMLQQTQAARVAERFPPFLARFPTPAALAAATDAQALAAWSGLGYNRRALALRRTALAVTEHGWPTSVAGLGALPGIGPYTARAVAALAFGEPVGAVDTNVRRWLVRRFGLAPDARPAALQDLADALADPASDGEEAAAWLHASMEFGAAICTARAPRCDACPVARGCPSRGRPVRVPVPRQPAFAGSARAVRGAILRALARAPGHALSRTELAPLAHGGELGSILASLEADGLAHRTANGVRLGPPLTVPHEAAATIGP